MAIRRGDRGPGGPWPASLVTSTAQACVAALDPFTDRDWRATRARDLDWSVWDTVVHVDDDLYFYAAQVALADDSDYICLELSADDHATPARLLSALTVQARLLAAAVTIADPTSRAHHVFGVSDPVGFAAMGVVEALVHTYDAVHGLDATSTLRPPDDLAGPVLARLFPDAEAVSADSAGELLLHLCGRVPLGDRPRPTGWQWDGTVRDQRP